jgi:NAD(P)H-hydrate repair Nnr-like enzyme with NAD(P)H-hydrate dehydratase domain
LDAAACHLVLESGFPDAARFRTLLTPHAGEWRSLGAPAIQSTDDLEPASEFVQNRLGASVYHKGAVSVLFHHTPERSVQLYIRNNPSAALSVAGSGDVLTGILLALFSRKDSTHEGYTRTIPNIVGAAVDLLLNSVMGSIHPRSDQFPELIRSHLLSGGTELK